MRTASSHKWGWAVGLALLALTANACGGNDSGGAVGGGKVTPTSAATTAPLKSLLPADLAAKGKITVGSDVSYAPNEFFKEGTQEVQGLDYDLAQAMGKQLGVTFDFQNSTFDGLIAALASKRFDVIISSMSDTKEREGKGLDFVDYFNAGTSILVGKGNPKKIQSLDDLCGRTIGLQRGTTQDTLAAAQKTKCTSSGKGALTVLTFDKDTDALQALKTGRTVADMNDFPVAAYNAKISGGGADFEVVGQQIEAGPYGIAVPKDHPKLRDALQAALKAIVASGEYDTILTKWNVTQGALKTAAINAGT